MYAKLFTRYRYSLILLRELVITDFKLRYQGSVLGYLWSLLRPLFLFGILYVVFVYVLGIGREIPHWGAALLLGVVLWNFFTEITKQGLKSIVKSGGIIRKINFPKYVIVVSTSLSAVINLLINLVIVFIFSVINNVELTAGVLLLIPIIIEIYVFALGLAFILGTLNVKYRDIDYIWEIITQALFYGSAIMFPISRVIDKSHKVAEVLLLNPAAQAIQDARHFAITPSLETIHTVSSNPAIIAAPYVLSIGTLIIGAFYFRKKSPKFAEEI